MDEIPRQDPNPLSEEGDTKPPPDPEEEPTATGTLFIMIVFLIALAGLWGIMYLQLLGR